MPACRFQASGVPDLVFGIRPMPPRVHPNTNIAASSSAGAVDSVYDMGMKSTDIILEWGREVKPGQFDSPFRKVDYDRGYDWATGIQTPGTQSLVNWHKSVANGRMVTFVYIDPRGVSWLVRLMNNQLNFKPAGNTGGLSGSLYLKVGAIVVGDVMFDDMPGMFDSTAGLFDLGGAS